MNNIKELHPKEGVTLLAVKVPDGAYDFKIQNSKLYYGGCVFTYKIPERWDTYKKENWVWSTLTLNKLVILGKATEIPEEVWQGIVVKNKTHNGVWYTYFKSMPGVIFNSATESAMSFLEANEVYSVNPYGKPDIQYYMSDSAFTMRQYHEELEKWQQAEDNTGTWVILLKL